MQIAQEKTYPWPKTANVIYPLMTTAAIQFAAKAYPAIVSGRNIVKVIVIGDDRGIPAMNPLTGQPSFKWDLAGKRKSSGRFPLALSRCALIVSGAI
jgi:hypothetical protein